MPTSGTRAATQARRNAFERLDPGQVVVDAVARAGDEPGVGLARRGGHLAGDDADDGELERRVGGAEERSEHRRVVAVAGLEVGVDLAGFEDAELHRGAPPCLWRT